MNIKEIDFKLERIIRSITKKICLICSRDLDKDLRTSNWHIPLCRKHRADYLDTEAREILA